MRVEKTQETASYIRLLWKKFLLSGAAGELLLNEVAEHLYIGDVPRELRGLPIPASGRDRAAEYAVLSGFAEDIEDAVAEMDADPRGTMPYSELLSLYTPEALMDALMDTILSSVHRCDAREVLEDPYYRAVRAPHGRAGDFRLGTADLLPFEFFQAYHETYDAGEPFTYASAGFFTDTVRFPVLFERDTVWMSIVLSEIRSMAPDIARARGRVVTYGLGLGYFAFMAAEKPEVESVTAVELDPAVIRLFEENILPQFPHKEKIHIVRADAYDFIEKQEDGAYDFAYADFWAGVRDGTELYLRLVPLAARFRKTQFAYWIESCFAEYVFRPVLMRMLMKEGLGRRAPLPANEAEAEAVQKEFEGFLRREPITVRGRGDIDRLLAPESVTELMRKFAIARGNR